MIPARTRQYLAALAAALFAHAACAALPADAPFEHRIIPGVSPEPLPASGLKGRDDLEAFFDGLMAAHLGAQRIAGAVVVVVKDGQVYFSKGYGYADVERRIAVDPERTLFHPGSISKLFTWTAVMQLAQQGKLDLDRDVNAYLTQFQLPATWPRPVTLRNLMTHSGGFEDGLVGVLMGPDAAVPPLAQALGEHIPTRVRPPAADFRDGLDASYSNWGTALAGLIVANVSGMPFEDYIARNIFAPLGMDSSSFAQKLPPDLAGRLAYGYKFEDGAFNGGREYVKLVPAGGLSASAADMARFMIAQLQDGRLGEARILEPATAQYMQARRFSPGPYVDGFGLGFFERWINGRRWIGHGGDLIYFHSNLWLLKEQQLGVFIAFNGPPALQGGGDDLQAFADRYFPAALPPLQPPPGFEQRAAKYAGTYRTIRHSFTRNEKLFALLLLGDVTLEPAGDGTLIMSGGDEPLDTRWAEVAPQTFRRIDTGDLMSFPEDAAGQVRGMVWPYAAHALYKLKWYETLRFHGLILLLSQLCFIAALVSALRHWKADSAGPAAPRRARRLAALLWPCHLILFIALGAIAAGGLQQLVYGWPTLFKVALLFPLLALPLTLAVLVFAWRAWRERYWTRYQRFQYSAAAALAVAFLWSLHFMNLVGFKFA